MRYSKQREEILKVVKSLNFHPMADDVYKRVQRSMPHISLGTVYRNLNALVDQEELSCVQDGKIVRYDWETGPHHHFRCRTCGTLYNVEIADEDILKFLAEKCEFEVKEVDLEMTGICGECSNGTEE